MIAKVELGAEIARIALANPATRGDVLELIQKHKNNNNSETNRRKAVHEDPTREQDGLTTEAVNPNDCTNSTQQYK